MKHLVTQKVTGLRGEAHLLPGTNPPTVTGRFPDCLWNANYTSKRLLPSQVKSVLMPDRKESGHEEGRKPNRVGIKVMQHRGLAAFV